MYEHLPEYLAAVALITVSPGPDTALVLNRALRSGRREAFLTACGSASGLLVWGTAAAFGIATLVAASATAFVCLKIVGAAYLTFLGARILRAAWTGDRPASVAHGPRHAPSPALMFRQGLLTNLLNPKAAAFFTALLPQFVTPGESAALAGIVYAAIAAAASLGGLTAYAYVAHRARRFLETRRARRALDSATGLVLIGLGARLAFGRH